MAKQSRGARTQAFTDLMDKPLLRAAVEPEAYQRGLYFESELRDWFRIYTGWNLERNREMLRLVRTPALFRPGLGLRILREPRDYLLLTLILYYAELSAARSGPSGALGGRFLLSLLATELVETAQQRWGSSAFDFGDQGHRWSLFRAMRALEEMGCITQLDGSANEWASQDGSGDGLYAFTESIAQVLPGRIRLEIEGLQSAGHTLHLPVDQTVEPEQRMWRALLLGPVLFRRDDPEAFAALLARQTFVSRELFDYFGWRLDIRQGMARVLRETHAQDANYVLLSARWKSEYGPVLLLCNRIRRLVEARVLHTDADGGITLPATVFEQHLLGLRDEHRDRLAGGLGTCGPTELSERVLGVMRLGGFLRGPDRGLNVYLTPLVACYQGVFATPEISPKSDEEASNDGQLVLPI